jgi:hypothetical protein
MHFFPLFLLLTSIQLTPSLSFIHGERLRSRFVSSTNPVVCKKPNPSLSSSSSLQSSIPLEPLLVPDSSTTDHSNKDESSAHTHQQHREQQKQSLIRLCSSFDRGFGSTPRIRKEVEELIHQLESMNPMASVAASRGVDGKPVVGDDDDIPLKGAWRMIWTSALDVLNLGASPTVVPAGIYQVIDPPIATNIIDLIPRAQGLLPVGFPSTIIRAEVQTRASIRDSNRVGLQFEAVQLKPVEILGFKADRLPPLKFDLPRININDLPGVDPKTAPGFFDVTYLDGDMLIIKQNAPGGYFVNLRVSNYDP